MASLSGYPFVTRRELQARLQADATFMMECAAVLQARTEQRAAGAAPVGKAWGWMSSERVIAGRLTAVSKIGMLSIDDEAKLAKLVSRYSRQLADHFRSIAIQENPGLSAAAEKFSVLPGGSTPSDISRGPRNPQESPERCHPSAERQPDVSEDNLESGPEVASEAAEPEHDASDDDDIVTDDGADPEPVGSDELAPRVMAYVERSPGQRTDAIAKALDTTTAMLAPTLRMLVQGRQLRKQGFGRGTRYFVR